MSHLDGLSPAEALAGELAACADAATGNNATEAKAIAQLIDFKTRERMRLSSAIKLEVQMEKKRLSASTSCGSRKWTSQPLRSSGHSKAPLNGTIGACPE